jgi:hypothetical protein
VDGYNSKKTTTDESTEILIDDVVVDVIAGLPVPVPDGVLGLPVRADRADPDGRSIRISWDTQCEPPATKILYGPLDQVADYTLSGAVCGIANPETWQDVPEGDLWFVLVGDNLGGLESSWGQASAGERNGLAASGTCGSSVKDLSGTCT